MKILTIAATPFFSNRGCHLRIYNEAAGLEKLGNKIQICTYHNGQNIPDLDIQRIENVSWYQKTDPGFAWGKLWLDWKLFWLVRKQSKIFTPDILHCHLYEGLAVGWLANLFSFKRIPLLFDLQGDLENELENYNSKNFLVKKVLPFFSGFFLARADAIVISSQRGKKVLQKKYPRRKNVAVVADGVNLNLFFEQEKKQPDIKAQSELKEINLWKKNAQLIIYAGGLSSAKGLLNFFRFFGQNFSRQEDWKFLIFGSGKEKKTYQQEIEKNHWESIVFLAEEENYFQLPFYLSLAKLAVEPKNNSTESSGKLPVYMAAGLPILCFDNAFNRDRLQEQGLYFNSWEEIKKILKEFSFSKPPAYFLEKLSNEKEAKKLEEVMRKLL